MKEKVEGRSFFSFRKVPNIAAGYAGLGSQFEPELYDGVGLPITSKEAALLNLEQIQLDLPRTTFFYDVLAPLNVTETTKVLLNNSNYTYVQSEYDGGLSWLIVQTIFLEDMFNKNKTPEADLSTYIGSMRLVFIDDDNVLSALGVSWIKDRPSVMVICIVKNLEKPSTERPSALFISDSTIEMMGNVKKYLNVYAELIAIDTTPDEHIKDQIKLILNQEVLTNKIIDLLNGKEINMPVINPVLSDNGYKASNESSCEKHKLNVSRDQVLTPVNEKTKPFVNANTLMMQTLIVSMQDLNQDPEKIIDVAKIKATAFGLFFEEIASELQNVYKLTQIESFGSTSTWKEKFNKIKNLLNTVTTPDIGQAIQQLATYSNQLKEGEIASEIVIEACVKLLNSLDKNPHLHEAVSAYLEELNWLELNANEMFNTYEGVKSSTKTHSI